ncbi:MAG: dihydrofolate reductase family protein [Candidatus Dormiibacterota bacterium]
MSLGSKAGAGWGNRSVYYVNLRSQPMRDVILQQYAVSLDSFSCADNSEFQQYVFGLEDPEQDQQFIDSLRRAGTHIMGRCTYEDMAKYWPTQSNPIADAMNGIPKVVFSRTLERAEWAESRIARGDTAEEIAKLKEEPGGEIVAHGGFRFTQSLVQLGLADELRLDVFPIALGHGTSIFATVEELTKFQLVSSRQFGSGAVLQTLRPIRSGRDSTEGATGASR